MYCRAARVTGEGQLAGGDATSQVEIAQRVCQAYELYRLLESRPTLSFEWAWNLYHALLVTGELYFAWCAGCDAPYVQDRYALDYEHCPACELREQQGRRAAGAP